MELGKVQEILCERISPFAGQPRKYFNKQKMEELEESIKAVGQKVPGMVKLLPPGGRYAYELVDGERRWRVCTKLKCPFKAWIREDITDVKQQHLESVVANFGRADHSELEIQEAIKRVRTDFNLTLDGTAAVFGRSIGWVQQYLSLDKLDIGVRNMMSPDIPENQRLNFSHALLLTSLKPDIQLQVAATITKQGLKLKEAKYLVERHTGEKRRGAEWSPRAEYEKFRNFLQRSMVDLELFLKQPRNYFDEMFEHRNPIDLEKMSHMVASAIDNLTVIKQMLERIKVSNVKGKVG